MVQMANDESMRNILEEGAWMKSLISGINKNNT